MLNKIRAAVIDLWQSFLALVKSARTGINKLWLSFREKTDPLIARMEKTTLGGPLIRGCRNLGNCLYHIGSAFRHAVTGLLQLAKFLLGSFAGFLVAGGIAFTAVAVVSLTIIVGTCINVAKAFKLAAKALFGIKEKPASSQEAALSTQNSQENSALLVGKLGSPRAPANNIALTAEQHYQQERIKLETIINSSGEKIHDGIKKIRASEITIAKSTSSPQIKYQEEIMKEALLNDIYKPGKALVGQFLSALAAGIMAGNNTRGYNGRTTIEQLPEGRENTTNRPNSGIHLIDLTPVFTNEANTRRNNGANNNRSLVQ